MTTLFLVLLFTRFCRQLMLKALAYEDKVWQIDSLSQGIDWMFIHSNCSKSFRLVRLHITKLSGGGFMLTTND